MARWTSNRWDMAPVERLPPGRAFGEPVYLGPGDDTYNGQNSPGPGDVIYGQGGDDVIRGLRGNDRLYGGTGDDTLLAGKGHDRLVGGAGEDSLQASEHRNVLIGGAGADAISLGSGLQGGSGNRIVFKHVSDSLPGDQHDLVTAFQSGVDRVDLERIDADTATPNDDAFSWIGAKAFGGVAGELRYDPSTGLLQGDTNGDGVSDFEVYFRFGSDVHSGDVIL